MANNQHVRIFCPNQHTADEDRQDLGERTAQRETNKLLIEAFVRRQVETRQLRNFANVAKLYADASKAEPYDVRLERVLRELQEWLLAGRFHRDGVPCVWAIHEREERRCNVLGEELPGFQITDEILQQFRANPNLDLLLDHLGRWVPHMWAPTDLCAQFLKEHGVSPPRSWANADTDDASEILRKEETRGRNPKYEWETYKRIFYERRTGENDGETRFSRWVEPEAARPISTRR